MVLFVHREKGNEVLFDVFANGIFAYTWVFSERISWSVQLKKMFETSKTSNNVIVIQLKRSNIREYQEFVEMFIKSKISKTLLLQLNECLAQHCLMITGFSFFIPYVVDAVNATAEALHDGFKYAKGISRQGLHLHG